LWLTWTHQRLGNPIPEAVMQRAAARPRGEWPRPALAAIAGKLAPEEMLKLVEAKAGDERHMALAEGYFYLGQHYLARGDQRRAQEMFERTRQQGVIGYIEHAAAELELRRLSAVLPAAPAPTAAAPAPARPVAQPGAKAEPVFSDAPPSEELRSAN
jgi:lipoprotein NlpI